MPITENGAPVGTQRVPCPTCRAGVGATCVTTTGGTPTRTHVDRTHQYASRMRSGFVARVKATNPRLGVTAGELYEARPYRLDPEKVTLLRRVPDGYDPECNHYWAEIEWARWEA